MSHFPGTIADIWKMLSQCYYYQKEKEEKEEEDGKGREGKNSNSCFRYNKRFHNFCYVAY